MTLLPGDLIVTGTPAGVGVFRDPPVFLQDGDRMEVHLEGVGVLANSVRRRA
jgi:2-keto-4-pentenoate hydratase/2-oxohepta-3-ene-1,7-dioic acid hydratase in catechol pathway